MYISYIYIIYHYRSIKNRLRPGRHMGYWHHGRYINIAFYGFCPNLWGLYNRWLYSQKSLQLHPPNPQVQKPSDPLGAAKPPSFFRFRQEVLYLMFWEKTFNPLIRHHCFHRLIAITGWYTPRHTQMIPCFLTMVGNYLAHIRRLPSL